MKKGKITSRNLSEMSFKKLTSYVKNKTFHMKSTKWKARNWKYLNTYPYEKRIDKEECSEISFWKSQNSYAKHKTIPTKINKFSYEINTSKNTNKNGRTMYTHYPYQIISKKNFHMKWHSPVFHQEIVYPRDIFSYEKR